MEIIPAAMLHTRDTLTFIPRFFLGFHMCMQGSDHTVEIIAAILLPVAILMCIYSLTVFIWRSKAISKKQVSPAMQYYTCCNCRYQHCVTVITVLPVISVLDTRSKVQ